MPYVNILIAYAVISNIAAVILTVYDKAAAKRHRRRIRESTLLCMAALSGCILMYLTMHIIRHKTKKPKFMIGIPLIFTAECIAIVTLLVQNGYIQF